jgi:hypothetical protein
VIADVLDLDTGRAFSFVHAGFAEVAYVIWKF